MTRDRITKRDLCKTASFAQSLRWAQILVLKILDVFLRLRFSPAFNLGKTDHFSKVSKPLWFTLFLAFGVLGSTSCVEGASKTKISVMKFAVGEGVKSSLGNFLYNSLVDEMLAYQKFVIVDWDEVDRVVSSIVKSRPGLSEKDARRQAVDLLRIQKMCIGSVTKLGDKFYVMVKIMNDDLTVDRVVTQSAESEDGLEGCIVSVASLLYTTLGKTKKLTEKRETRQRGGVMAEVAGLPSWLVAVRAAKYALLHGLEPGSREAQERQLRAVQELKLPLEVKTRKTGIALRLVPAGSFIMGSPWSGSVTGGDEGSMHQVTLSRPMYVAKFEITQGQWKAVMGYNPSRFKDVGENAPVENVSWDDCQEFCRMLAKLEASQPTSFRLPTEAEWEYSCRAGTAEPYAGEIHWMGWYLGNGSGRTHQVGTKASNAWGLHDMHGNVQEWCQDWYREENPPEDVIDPLGPQSGFDRVLRSGSWYHVARLCSSFHRFWEKPAYRYDWSGFRIVMTVNQ